MISGIKLQHLPLIGQWVDNVFTAIHFRFLLEGLGYSSTSAGRRC